MCDSVIEKVKLVVNGTLQERMVFRVERICDVVIDRIFSLLESNILVLDDNTIILRLGGDKGGNTMAFKFGCTVMIVSNLIW